MERWLPEKGLEYAWLGKELGGYRTHMRTKLFRDGIKKLMDIAAQKRTCIMCMEANPKYCHHRYISACLERKEVEVCHIVAKGQTNIPMFQLSDEGLKIADKKVSRNDAADLF